MGKADISVFKETILKKCIGIIIIIGFMALSVLLLLNKPITIPTIVCLIYNVLVVLCTLIWNCTIQVTKVQRKAVSIVLWYGVLWIALFTSITVLTTK